MPLLWGRSVILEFGESGKTGVKIDTSKILDKSALPQITFDIKKTIISQNTAHISVYNLNETSREVVNKAKDDTLYCTLSAGYGDESFIIFKGRIQTGGSVWTGSEWVTTINTVDGVDAKGKKVNRSYAPDTTVKEMIVDSLENLGSNFKKVVLDVKKEVTENGMTLSGSVPMIIDKLIAAVPNQNLEFTIQDGVAYVKPATTLIEANTIVVVSPTTGMIGSPKKVKDGVEFTSVIQKGLSPGRGVELKSTTGTYNGIYIIQKTQMKGSLRGGEWSVTCEAKATSDYKIVRAP